MTPHGAEIRARSPGKPLKETTIYFRSFRFYDNRASTHHAIGSDARKCSVKEEKTSDSQLVANDAEAKIPRSHRWNAVTHVDAVTYVRGCLKYTDRSRFIVFPYTWTRVFEVKNKSASAHRSNLIPIVRIARTLVLYTSHPFN